MTARLVDVAPTGPVRFPDSGLGSGWEASAVIVLTALLLICGLVSLYNASSILAMGQERADTYYVLRQGIGVAIGVVVMAICAFIPYSVWSRLSWPLLLISIGSLVLLVVPWTESIAPSINGSRRWLRTTRMCWCMARSTRWRPACSRSPTTSASSARARARVSAN